MRPVCADRGCQPEEKWYALTGRVVDAKVEADGDIHLALQDADGKNAGTVSAEIPVGPKWCEIRQKACATRAAQG
jgi:flagellar basal body rod protein FlgF